LDQTIFIPRKELCNYLIIAEAPVAAQSSSPLPNQTYESAGASQVLTIYALKTKGGSWQMKNFKQLDWRRVNPLTKTLPRNKALLLSEKSDL